MTDTATQTKRAQKPRDVDYTLEIVDDLPDIDVKRRSPLEDQIEKIIETPDSHGRYVRIGSYANGSAASAAANVLRKRHGDKASVDGFEIRVKRADKDGQPRTGLFVKYDPKDIVDGAREEFEARLKAREDKVAAKRAAREAAAPKDGGEASGTSPSGTAGGTPEGATAKTPREKATSAGVKTGSADTVQKSKNPENKQ